MQDDPIHRALFAYAAFFALLTVHPFADGNGRTARMLYAALPHARGADSPLLTLALPLSFAEGGRRFHQAALLARSGHFHELRANFLDEVKLANDQFGRDVESLCSTLDNADRGGAARTFEDIRVALQALAGAF